MLWWTFRQLNSAEWQVRAAAAGRLGKSRKAKAIPALVTTLRDESRPVRQAAIAALGRIGDAKAIKPLIAALSDIQKSAKARGISRDAAQVNEEYEALAEALAGLSTPAVEPLVGLLSSGEKELRRWAAYALGLIKDPQAAAPLAEKLEDGRSEVRKAAIGALGLIGSPQSITPLKKALAHRDPETRRAAAQAVGQIGGEAAIEALTPAIADQDEVVQLATIDALRKIGSAKAALALKPALESDRKAVREGAATSVMSMDLAASSPVERAALAVMAGSFHDAIAEGEAAIGPLIEALQSKDPHTRALAAEALGTFRAHAAVVPLVRAFRDFDEKVREAAAEALVSIGQPAVSILQKTLESLDASEQLLSARVLGEIGDAASISGLTETVRKNRKTESSYPVPADAARAAAKALSKILSTGQEMARQEDLLVIAELPDAILMHPADPGAQSFREEMAVDCSELRTLARRELARRGTPRS